MPLKLIELTSDKEFPALMTTLYNSYSSPHNGFWDIFKGESEEECQSRYMQWHKADPSSHWIYVTDTESGQVIGGTQWNIFEQNPYLEAKAPMAAYWIQEGTAFRSIADSVLHKFLAGRPHRMNRPHMLVMWCGTHHEHRRRGAGLMMMKWGLDKADALGLDSFVEATEAGYEMYKAAGFITVDEFWADATTDAPTQEWDRLKEELGFPMRGYFMWRPPGESMRKDYSVSLGMNIGIVLGELKVFR